MIKVENITDLHRRCQSCGKKAKYEIRLSMTKSNFVDVIPLCYNCIDIVMDRLKQIEEAGNDELGKSFKGD